MHERVWEVVAVVAAIALAALMAAPWYESTVNLSGSADRVAEADAWRAFTVIDIVILVGVVVAAVATLLRERVVALIGAAAVLVVIAYRLVDSPIDEAQDYTVDPAWGAWLAAGVAVVLVAACWTAERRKDA